MFCSFFLWSLNSIVIKNAFSLSSSNTLLSFWHDKLKLLLICFLMNSTRLQFNVVFLFFYFSCFDMFIYRDRPVLEWTWNRKTIINGVSMYLQQLRTHSTVGMGSRINLNWIFCGWLTRSGVNVVSAFTFDTFCWRKEKKKSKKQK